MPPHASDLKTLRQIVILVPKEIRDDHSGIYEKHSIYIEKHVRI